MSLLDRYIFKSAFSICAAAVGLFAFLLMLGNFVRDLAAHVISGQISMEQTGRLVLLLFPFVISYALPMGLLTGVLLTLGRLSADNEISAMRSSGIGLLRVSRPVLILGLIGAAVAVRVNYESMPWARVRYDRELNEAIRANPLNFIVPRTFIKDFPGYVAYVGEKRADDVKDVWVWQLDGDRRVTRMVHAAEGRFDYDERTNDLILTLAQATVETRNEKNPEDFTEAEPVATFEKNDPMRLPLDKLFDQGGTRQKLRWMTYSQLEARKAAVAAEPTPAGGPKEKASDLMDIALVLQEKANLALAVFSFAFIGIPLGIKVSRRETTANLGVAVALALGYYFLNTSIGWLDTHPEYRPDLLLWAPNLLLLGLGVWLFRRIET